MVGSFRIINQTINWKSLFEFRVDSVKCIDAVYSFRKMLFAHYTSWFVILLPTPHSSFSLFHLTNKKLVQFN